MSKKIKELKLLQDVSSLKQQQLRVLQQQQQLQCQTLLLVPPKTLKMQAAWPSGANIFFEMAGDYAKKW